MDMKNISRLAHCGDMPDLSGCKILVGAKQLRKGLENGSIAAVYLAENADPNVTEPLAQLCDSVNIQPVWVQGKAELGRACGIDVGAAAAGVAK